MGCRSFFCLLNRFLSSCPATRTFRCLEAAQYFFPQVRITVAGRKLNLLFRRDQ